MRAFERCPKGGGRGFPWRPALHRHLLERARLGGIRYATSFHVLECSFADLPGCTGRSDFADPRHTICVELIDDADRLRKFRIEHGRVLDGRLMLFRSVERWSIE